MNNTTLFKTLQFDSLMRFLSNDERMMIHLFILGKSQTVTMKIKAAYDWIEATKWMPPRMKYEQDRLQYFFNPYREKWLLVDKYPKYLKNIPEFLIKTI
ncbi:hypothetical protein [Chryseobacterium sp.]|uniref:hypothetical protein n=1 Tax=Chryseobacterium sp. TaxID=1871047 RepID=UPI0028A1832A|nr:hypothetical protein [Chryseobacterium sp.]